MWKVFIGMFAFAWACTCGVSAANENIAVKSKALAHYIMGVTHDLNSQSALAISEYERSIALNPAESLPRLRLAAYYARSGRLEQAIKQLKTVLNADPQSNQARYILALIYSGQKKYDLAAQEYEQILKNAAQDNPDNLEIYTYLAQLYYSQGRLKDAIAQFKLILEIQPDNVSANFSLAGVYLELQKHAEAKEYFKKILNVMPDHDEALNSLAYIYAEEGTNLDDALTMANQAIMLDSSNGAYYDTLGWVLFKKGRNAESLMVLQKAAVYVQDAIVYEHLGDVYQAVKEFALARKFYKKSLDLEPHQLRVQEKIESLEKISAKIATE